jgi:hypothetical protein
MVAFVKSHAGFNAKLKELNRQLTKSLVILVWALVLIIDLKNTFL